MRALACAILCALTLAAAPRPAAAQSAKLPVLIVGGTVAAEIWYWGLEGRLALDGYKVRFYQLEGRGLIDMNLQADYLNLAVQRYLLDNPGVSKIHLIGHSQGGIIARLYVQKYGPATVESVISLGAPHQGTTANNALTQLIAGLWLGCAFSPQPPICKQMLAGSPLLAQLNHGPTAPSVYYTNFVTRNDEWVTPYLNGTMTGCDRASPTGGMLQCNVVHSPGRMWRRSAQKSWSAGDRVAVAVVVGLPSGVGRASVVPSGVTGCGRGRRVGVGGGAPT